MGTKLIVLLSRNVTPQQNCESVFPPQISGSGVHLQPPTSSSSEGLFQTSFWNTGWLMKIMMFCVLLKSLTLTWPTTIITDGKKRTSLLLRRLKYTTERLLSWRRTHRRGWYCSSDVEHINMNLRPSFFRPWGKLRRTWGELREDTTSIHKDVLVFEFEDSSEEHEETSSKHKQTVDKPEEISNKEHRTWKYLTLMRCQMMTRHLVSPGHLRDFTGYGGRLLLE